MYTPPTKDTIIPLKGNVDPNAPSLNLAIVNYFKELKFSCVVHASVEETWRTIRSLDRGYTFLEPAQGYVLKIGDVGGRGTRGVFEFDDGSLVYEVRFVCFVCSRELNVGTVPIQSCLLVFVATASSLPPK